MIVQRAHFLTPTSIGIRRQLVDFTDHINSVYICSAASGVWAALAQYREGYLDTSSNNPTIGADGLYLNPCMPYTSANKLCSIVQHIIPALYENKP